MVGVFFVGLTAVEAADSGFKSPSVNNNSGWDHPERVYSSENSRATANSKE
jgi:hypothetical protein